jgi:acetoacetyl-[acyl-carrier protein] synthase
MKLLAQCHTARAIADWRAKSEAVEQCREDIEKARLNGDWQPMYRFNDGVLSDEDIRMEADHLMIGDVAIDITQRLLPKDWNLKV